MNQKGSYGEKLAIDFLLLKNYKILERNFRIKNGEIDIIAKDSTYIVFIEVKYRKNLSKGFPRESVTFSKQKTIINVANHYIYLNNLTNSDFRFDVIEVYDIDTIKFEHIKNAFTVR